MAASYFECVERFIKTVAMRLRMRRRSHRSRNVDEIGASRTEIRDVNRHVKVMLREIVPIRNERIGRYRTLIIRTLNRSNPLPQPADNGFGQQRIIGWNYISRGLKHEIISNNCTLLCWAQHELEARRTKWKKNTTVEQ